MGGGQRLCKESDDVDLDSTTEQFVVPVTGPSPRGRDGVYVGSVAPGRAPDSKGPLDLGHQRDVSLVSPTLYTHRRISVS